MGELMKKRIYLTTIAVIAVSVAGLVIVNNTNNSTAQSPEKSVASTEISEEPVAGIEIIEGLEVRRTLGDAILPEDLEEMIARSDLIVIGKPRQSITESKPIVRRDSEGYVIESFSQTEFEVELAIYY
ncbi:MAG: hypothetical protein WA865_04480 [Spirulinaceae cyanobacterium]